MVVTGSNPRIPQKSTYLQTTVYDYLVTYDDSNVLPGSQSHKNELFEHLSHARFDEQVEVSSNKCGKNNEKMTMTQTPHAENTCENTHNHLKNIAECAKGSVTISSMHSGVHIVPIPLPR